MEERVAAIEAMLREETGRAFPGAVLHVRVKGRDRLVLAAGWTAEEGTAAVRAPVTPGTLFDLASLTKALCTMPVALSLTAEGRLDLAAPVGRHLPWLEGRWMGGVTTEQLLRHTAGLPAWRPWGPDLYRRRGPHCAGTPEARAFVRQAILRETADHPPGTACLYSDLGYLLVQEVCEAVGEAPLDVLFRERVARPLGLSSTGFRPVIAGRPSPPPREGAGIIAATEVCPIRGRCLQGEVHDENAWALGGVAGHAGLFSTAEEVARMVQAIRDCWAGISDWLTPAIVRSALDTSRRPPGASRVLGLDTPSGLGSMAGDRAPEGTVGHLGFTGTSFWVHLDGDAIIVMLTNRVHPTRERQGIREARRRLHDACWEAIGRGETVRGPS